MGSAAAASRSCDLLLGHGLEVFDFVPTSEGDETFLARRTVLEIGLQDALDRPRRVIRPYVAINIAAERGWRPEAATDQDVVPLDGIAIGARLHFAGQKPDLADEMLRA